jgi:hypothetical protein
MSPESRRRMGQRAYQQGALHIGMHDARVVQSDLAPRMAAPGSTQRSGTRRRHHGHGIPRNRPKRPLRLITDRRATFSESRRSAAWVDRRAGCVSPRMMAGRSFLSISGASVVGGQWSFSQMPG